MQCPEKVSVIGLGYIGLPTAAILASRKIHVVGIDVNEEAVATINRGDVHIVEPDLDIVVRAAVSQGYLQATSTPEPADAFIIAVPTPFKNGHEPDLEFIEHAVRSVASVLEAGNLVILESTSPVGTTEMISRWLAKERPDLTFPHERGGESDIRVAYCPERVLPGQVLRELVDNDRVIGGITPECSKAAIRLYRAFVEGQCVVTDSRTAEMTKLTENSFRDVNIAFANELSLLCEKLDVDVWELIRLANRHPRVDILQPGPGVGGHCLAVDPWFLVSQAPDQSKLIQQSRRINDEKPIRVIEQIADEAKKKNTRTVICLGASFKPNIDDLRNSPAISIINALSARGYKVRVVEPHIEHLPRDLVALPSELISLEKAIDYEKPNVLAVLVAHNEFVQSRSLRLQSPLDFCGALTERRIERREEKLPPTRTNPV